MNEFVFDKEENLIECDSGFNILVLPIESFNGIKAYMISDTPHNSPTNLKINFYGDLKTYHFTFFNVTENFCELVTEKIKEIYKQKQIKK